MHAHTHKHAQEAVTTAIDLKKAANELFKKEKFLPASEKYTTALFWIAPLVKSPVPAGDEATLMEARKEAVVILCNLSSTMLKLSDPPSALRAATESVDLNMDGSYFKVRHTCLVASRMPCQSNTFPSFCLAF